MAARMVRGLASMGNGSSSMMDGGSVMRSSSTPQYKGATNEHGEPHGEGRRVFSSGHVYEGQWLDGKCHGFGRFAYPDGQVFEGEWARGRRNGKGKLAMPSGEMIAGVWVDDSLSGSVQKWTQDDEKREQAERAKEEANAKKAKDKEARKKKKKKAKKAKASKSSGDDDDSSEYESESDEEEEAEAEAEAPPTPRSRRAKKKAAEKAAAEREAEEKDVKWLRESHDVIWQLNVELQMENERLTSENRRLRLKLRSMISNELTAKKEEAKPVPKVVEGRLRREGRKKKEKAAQSTSSLVALITEQMGGSGRGFESYSSDVDAAARRRRIVSELCDKAEEELKEELRAAEWQSLKKLDGSAEAHASKVFKALLEPVRTKPSSYYHSDSSVGEMSACVLEAKNAVASWPDGYSRLLRRSGLDAKGLHAATELKVANAGLGPGGAGALCLLLRASKRLSSVDLSGNDIGDAGACLVAEAIKSAPGLKSLQLADNRIGGSGGGALAAALSQGKSLSLLDLSQNRLGDEGGVPIADALRRNRGLAELSLRANALGSGAAQALAAAMRSNKQVTFLDVRENSFDRLGENALRTAAGDRAIVDGGSGSDAITEQLLRRKGGGGDDTRDFLRWGSQENMSGLRPQRGDSAADFLDHLGPDVSATPQPPHVRQRGDSAADFLDHLGGAPPAHRPAPPPPLGARDIRAQPGAQPQHPQSLAADANAFIGWSSGEDVLGAGGQRGQPPPPPPAPVPPPPAHKPARPGSAGGPRLIDRRVSSAASLPSGGSPKAARQPSATDFLAAQAAPAAPTAPQPAKQASAADFLASQAAQAAPAAPTAPQGGAADFLAGASGASAAPPAVPAPAKQGSAADFLSQMGGAPQRGPVSSAKPNLRPSGKKNVTMGGPSYAPGAPSGLLGKGALNASDLF